MEINKDIASKIISYLVKKAGYDEYIFKRDRKDMFYLALLTSGLDVCWYSEVYCSSNKFLDRITVNATDVAAFAIEMLKKIEDGNDIYCFCKNTANYKIVIPRHSTLEQMLIEADLIGDAHG